MNFCYWYAVIQSAEGAPVAPAPAWGMGLDDRPLRCVVSGALAAVISDWPVGTMNRSAETVDAARVWRHEQVIEQIMADRPVLPVRFGTVMADETRIAAALVERQATMLADLAHITGCVELGVRVLWDPPAATEPAAVAATTPGAQYLLQRAAQEQARRAVQEQGRQQAVRLHQTLRKTAQDGRETILATERMLLSAAYLVRHEQISGFLGTVEALRSSHEDLAFLCSGPWPPYHFVSA